MHGSGIQHFFTCSRGHHLDLSLAWTVGLLTLPEAAQSLHYDSATLKIDVHENGSTMNIRTVPRPVEVGVDFQRQHRYVPIKGKGEATSAMRQFGRPVGHACSEALLGPYSGSCAQGVPL